ncbi:MAG: glutamate--tRNA ligase [Thermoplasmata archaeon]|jgi:glutamyl-tRNA synthetase
MAFDEQTLQRLRRLALENAVRHGSPPRPESVLSRALATEPELRPRATEAQAAIRELVDALSAQSPAEWAAALDRMGGARPLPAPSGGGSVGEFPELPGALPGRVVLRLAPFPSGALHIGNGRLLYVNDYYRQRYGGQLYLVFDDTIGSDEKRIEPEFFQMILDDLELTGVRPDWVFYKSDRVPRFYPWARRVIDVGGAYVCRCPADELRENRRAGRACPERSQSVGETMELWEQMLAGRFEVGEAVLRLRTDLQDPDPAFRDRVLFRLSDFDHPRVGRKYRVWPMLEFSWAVDDVELGITHVLRGKDLVIEDRMQEYIWKLLGIQGPPFLHWGILRVREAKLSKSKSYAEVKSGQYDGWADPRTWSFRSLERRGIRMEAVRKFVLSFGLSLSDVEVPAETLYAENRQIIDATTPRRAFVARPRALTVRGFPRELTAIDLANHPDRPELGRRTLALTDTFYLSEADLSAHRGEEIRLKDLLNLRLPEELSAEGPIVGEFTSRENRRLPRLQWVPREGAVPIDLLQIDGSHTAGVGEPSIATAEPGASFQFERVGFVRLEVARPRGEVPVRVVFGHP